MQQVVSSFDQSSVDYKIYDCESVDEIPEEQLAYEVIYQYLEDCRNGIYNINQFIKWLHKERGQFLCEIAGIDPAYLERGIKERMLRA